MKQEEHVRKVRKKIDLVFGGLASFLALLAAVTNSSSTSATACLVVQFITGRSWRPVQVSGCRWRCCGAATTSIPPLPPLRCVRCIRCRQRSGRSGRNS